jgi:hypothetical protein
MFQESNLEACAYFLFISLTMLAKPSSVINFNSNLQFMAGYRSMIATGRS